MKGPPSPPCGFGGPAIIVGAWRSLVARLLWEQDVAGSNPVAPTTTLTKAQGIKPKALRFLVTEDFIV